MVSYKKTFDQGAEEAFFYIETIAINTIGLPLAVPNMESGFARSAVRT